MAASDTLLEVRDLKVWFPIKKGIFSRTTGYVKAVDGISFELRRGETLGVVGESGCGKSTTSRAILGLNKPTDGVILFNGHVLRRGTHARSANLKSQISNFTGVGEELPSAQCLVPSSKEDNTTAALSTKNQALGTATKSPSTLTPTQIARHIQVVFQDPQASLNPRHTVMEILTEGMVYHGLCTKANRRAKAAELLASVGLPDTILDRYPHEFSGGQRQRLCIARAVALKPELLICDEAVSALDLSIRAQVLDLLADLKKKLGLTILFITHDLGVVQHIADRIIVMNKGKIVESGACRDVLGNPQEDYTKRLMAAVPVIGKPLA